MNIGSFRLKYPFIEKEPAPVFYDEEAASLRLGHTISSYIPEHSQPIVFVCIGTDRSTGDSLGPLVGSKLLEKNIRNFHVYGTLDEPVHALNLEETLVTIQKEHVTPFIVAVDACLGKSQNVGSISIGKGPSKPGAAMNKQLPAVGNIHIHGIVNIHGFMEFFVLQNTRLNLVIKMADTISKGIQRADYALSYHKQTNHLS
ncbi:spore protease YyaC [Ectobacillus antri]|uniref:Spore protease YyaC n=1 Tax=Ectobacillus antri TaxID=2486280 RepID=A0ABT6H8X0_9BACI|nr:spore protease YyaC [Ectobacillus antri]MDG4657560.1 spore protease YyaC [Ectobacillus antri]MDG5755164.1 spore protease YyaC [Ectobacillus antri]